MRCSLREEGVCDKPIRECNAVRRIILANLAIRIDSNYSFNALRNNKSAANRIIVVYPH